MTEKKERIFTKDFLVICLCMFTSGYVLYALNSSVPLYVQSLGGSASMSGALNTCFTMSACVARIFGGHLSDRFGRKKVIAAGALIFTAATAFYTISSTMPMLVLFRSFQGVGYAVMSIGASTALVDILPESRYGEGLGYSALANVLSSSTAPSVVIWLSGAFDFRTVFLTTAAVALCGALSAVLFCNYEKRLGVPLRAADSEPRERASLRSLVWRIFERQAMLPALIQTLTGTGFAFAYVYMTLYAVNEGIARPGLYFTFSSVAALLTRIVGGKLSDQPGKETPCLAVGFVLGILSFLILAFTKTPWIFYLCGAMWGMGQGLISPITNRLAVLGVAPERRGAASATYSISADIGNGLGGILWGLVVDHLGYVPCFYLIALWEGATFVAAMAFMAARRRTKAASV